MAVANAVDTAGQPIEIEYQWSVDGRVLDVDGPRLDLPSLSKRQRVEVRATAQSAGGKSEPVTARLEIPNRAPVLERVSVLPERGVALGGELRASAKVSDADRDRVEIRHQWLVNGKQTNAMGEAFSTDGLSPGDVVQVEVSAFDGEVLTRPRRSAPVGVLENHAPRIVSQPGAIGETGEFRYTLEVEDAENDVPFRFSLLEGPKGMTIDAGTGEIVWRPKIDQVGETIVDVAVHDAQGSGAAQRFSLKLSAVAPAKDESASSPPASPRRAGPASPSR